MTIKTENTTLITLAEIARAENVKPAYVRRLARVHEHFAEYPNHNWFWDTAIESDVKSIDVVKSLAKSLVKTPTKKTATKKRVVKK